MAAACKCRAFSPAGPAKAIAQGRQPCPMRTLTTRRLASAGAAHSGRGGERRQRQRTRLAAGQDGKGGSGGGGGFGDDLLDFMYAGKKLRKWYGSEGLVLPKDGGGGREEQEGQQGGPDEEEEEEPAEREYIVVLDADSSAMAEQVVLQLILNRAKIRALVKDASAARGGFGPYIEAVQGDSADPAALRKLLRGARAAVCCGPLGALLPAAAASRLPHVVLLSSVGAKRGGLAALFGGGEQGVLGDASREQQLASSGVPYTLLQVDGLSDAPGGSAALALAAGSGRPQGQVAREDAAKAVAEAAGRDPSSGSLAVQLSSSGSGAPPADWQAAFAALQPVRA